VNKKLLSLLVLFIKPFINSDIDFLLFV